MKVGDQALFYHLSVKPPGVAGICEIAGEHSPDLTELDPASKYRDPKSDSDNPRCLLAEVTPVQALPRFVSLEELRGTKSLAKRVLLQRGQRSTIQPVTAAEFRTEQRIAAKRPATSAGS